MYLFIFLCIYLLICLCIYLFIYTTYIFNPFLIHINPIVQDWLPHESVGSSEGAAWNSWQLCSGFCFPDFFYWYSLFLIILMCLCHSCVQPFLVADAAGLDTPALVVLFQIKLLIWTRAHPWHVVLFHIKHNDFTLVHTHPFGAVVQLVVPMKHTIQFILPPQLFQYAHNPQELHFVHGVQFLECRIRLWVHEPKMVYGIWYIYNVLHIDNINDILPYR